MNIGTCGGERRAGKLAAALFLAACLGCVEIEQEIHVNHDGSGRIVEKINLSPRGARMLEGAARQAGQPARQTALFSEEVFQERLKSMGEVTLESRKEVKLPDGRIQIQATYTFRDLNKVRLWVVPTLSYKLKHTKDTRMVLDGALRMSFRPEYVSWGRIWRETVQVESPRLPPMAQPIMSPAEREKFLRVLPIFLDMIQDLRLSIVLVAPIEEFEEPKDMLWNLPADRNRVTLFHVDGRGMSHAPSAMLQLIMDEVVDTGVVRGAPGIFTAWPVEHGGRGMRFMKSIPAPQTE